MTIPAPGPPDWRRELESLPRTWPRSLKDQTADPVARAAVRRAYEAGAPVAEIRRRTGRSLRAVRGMLSREGVLHACGARGRHTRLPPGCRSWAAHVKGVVRRRLADGTYRAEWPLPPYRVLARELGVEPGVVYKVVRQLRDEGRLRREGRRLVVVGTNPAPAEPRDRSPPPPDACRRVGARLRTARPGPASSRTPLLLPRTSFPFRIHSSDRNPVTRFTVLDETRRHPGLREQFTTVLHSVAPLVHETTGLALPAQVRFRLLTPKQWRTAVRQKFVRVLARDIADLELTPKEAVQARNAVKAAGFVPVLTWPLVAAVTMEAADGQVETVTAPRTLHHAGFLADERYLTRMTVHELVHHAQFAARGRLVWESLFLERRGLSSRTGGITVLEGHATWADHRITTRLYGTPVDHTRDARRSWRFRLHAALPGASRLGPRLAFYEQGAQLITTTVDMYGTAAVNRVWTDTSLLPTDEEIAAPDTWARRLAASPAGHH
ncbi:zinc-dependent metalloprotease [Streptomyces sp. NPDC004539]|uniref:zinc-dependent metalloprotease n=1 Tax=Streptomyces sp. NPDC004539 TaxID=3154280 RepID=UPI0033A75569